METYTGTGCWPGRAEGRIHWAATPSAYPREPVADRAGEIVRFKMILAQALADIDQWMDRQPDLGGRLVLQPYREALQEWAFTSRVITLIDQQGLPVPAALVQAAELVAGVMGRNPDLAALARALPAAAGWLAGRVDPAPVPAGVVLAAPDLSPLELLDRTQPAIIAADDPGVKGEAPLIWGVAALSPDWTGRHAQIDGNRLQIAAEEVVSPMQQSAVRQAVLDTARRMKQDGLVRLTSGNVSCRIPGTNRYAITPSGMEYSLMEPEDICILDLDGRVVDARRRPSTEARLHQLTYRRRPELNGVVHTHSRYASAFACTGQDLPVISIELAGLVGGVVRCAPYARAGTEEFAETALRILGDRDVALLLQNHGVMAAGATLTEAYNVAVGLEEAALLYVIARQVGEPVILPEAECRRIFRVMHSAYGQPQEQEE